LVVSGGRDPQRRLITNVEILDWDEVDPSRVTAEDGEALDLAAVIALEHSRVRVVGVGTADLEDDPPVP
jgi:hypothetical protein